MAYKVDNKGDGFYHVKFHSPICLEEIISAIQESEGFLGTKCELWDLSETDFNFSSDQLSSFAQRARAKTNKPQKTAIVVSEDLVFGLARIYSSYREEKQTDVDVFRTEKEALAWLFDKRPDISQDQ